MSFNANYFPSKSLSRLIRGIFTVLVIIICVGCGNNSDDSSNINWKVVTTMPTPRYELTSEIINGKIFTLGGIDGVSPNLYKVSNKVEAYDPETNVWQSMAPTPTLRYSAASVVLNEKIWVLGGHHEEVVTRTNEVEIYDPVNNAWDFGVPMLEVRQELAAATFADKIYAFGGTPNGTVTLNSVEEYDPLLDIWQLREPMPRGRTGAVAVTVGSLIYIIGGIDNSSEYVRVIDVYNPLDDTWSTLSSILSDNSWYPSVAVLNSNIIICGGTRFVTGQGMVYSNTTIELDPVNDMIQDLPPMPIPRAQHNSVTYANKLYLFGGVNRSSGVIGEVHVFSK